MFLRGKVVKVLEKPYYHTRRMVEVEFNDLPYLWACIRVESEDWEMGEEIWAELNRLRKKAVEGSSD